MCEPKTKRKLRVTPVSAERTFQKQEELEPRSRGGLAPRIRGAARRAVCLERGKTDGVGNPSR